MAHISRGQRREHGVDVSVLVIDRRQSKPVSTLRHGPFHSTDRFAWGEHGSGPADVVLAILAEYCWARPPRPGWVAGEPLSRWTVDSRACTHQVAGSGYTLDFFGA